MTKTIKTTSPRQRKPKAASVPVIQSIKGFDSNLACRGFQFEQGKTYEHTGPIAACLSGFHACTIEAHPLEVLGYYPPAGSRYCLVEQTGATNSDDDIKIASAKITIGIELSISDLTKRAIEWVFARAKKAEGSTATGTRGAASATGYQGAASATGYQGAASATGYQGAASATGTQGAASATGTRGAASATGTRGAASATGTQGAASATGTRGAASATGTRGAASATGYQGAASATGTRGAASATGTRGAASATGTRGAASATGTRGAASATGYQGAASATGTRGAAMASGYAGTVSGVGGNAIFAVERDGRWNIVSVAAGIVGRDGINANTPYHCKGGKLVEGSL
jgi:hypothetical protein